MGRHAHMPILLYCEYQIASYYSTVIAPQYQLKKPYRLQIANTAKNYLIVASECPLISVVATFI